MADPPADPPADPTPRKSVEAEELERQRRIAEEEERRKKLEEESKEDDKVSKKGSKDGGKGSKKGSKENNPGSKKGSKDGGKVSKKGSKDSENLSMRKSRESVDGGTGDESVVEGEGHEGKSKGKGKDKGKGLAEQRGSLKFGDYDEPKKGKKKDKKEEKTEEDEKPEKSGFDASKHKKPTVVLFHDKDDLMWSKGVGYKPDDAVPKNGPGVTAEIENLYGPCALLSEFKYTTWADTVVPLKNHNVVQGFNEMALCLIKLAANGGENMSHEDAFLAVSFLSNVRNDLGEYPPNILALMEHIDYLTQNDGKAGSGKPKFRQMDACKIKEWY